MEALFSAEYKYAWIAAMTVALFFPVRQFIWVMTVRRAIKKGGEENVDAAEQDRLKRRAAVTSAMLSFLFSLGYINVLFAK